ncbi:MAG: hypothetical protein ACI88G_002248 [Woeseiaceae bacterium]|jgi:hypothetical protein
MKITHKLSLGSLVVTLLFLGGAASAAGLGNNIAVRLVGTADMHNGDTLFENFDLTPEGALCYDLDVVDVKSGDVIGSAADCLTNISPVDDGVALTGTTFFFFLGGTVVTRGLTTVQPTTHGSADFTHITGAIPQPGDNNVIYGDGKFKNASGSARLSGAVNLSNFPAQAVFDCVFILDLGPGHK